MGDAGLPFLGSLMSLITHGEVRYEGILAEVDMSNSSLRLSNVRCLGTEGRLGGVNEVPTSDQVFETVVFKAAEVKDLTVMQNAPPPAPPGAYPGAAPPPAPSPWGPPPPAPPAPAPGQPGFGASPWGAPAGAPPAPAPHAAPAPPHKANPAPAPTVAIQSVPKTAGGDAANGGAAGAPRARPLSYAHAAGGVAGGPGRGGPGRGRGPPRGGHVNQGGRGAGRGHPPHHHHHHHPPPPPMTIPTEEFDFEAALKRFNKDELLKDVGGGEGTPVLPDGGKMVYKKDDFFDELSCEALERSGEGTGGVGGGGRGRGAAAARRRTDMETFGRVAGRGRGPPGYNNNRGGRGAGRGGRGGREGGRGSVGASSATA